MNPSAFIQHYTAPLNQEVHILGAINHVSNRDIFAIAAFQDTARKQKLRSLLASLENPAAVSRQVLDDAIEFSIQLQERTQISGLPANAGDKDQEEWALQRAVVNKVAVVLYAHSMDTFLSESIELEDEAEWWADVERSWTNVFWYLLQTFPGRCINVWKVVLNAVQREHPSRSTFTALRQSLIRSPFQPSILLSSLFPHTASQASFSLFLPLSTTPVGFLHTFRSAVMQCLHSLWRFTIMPLELTRTECHLKKRELRDMRDERAKILGNLSILRQSLADSFQSLQDGDEYLVSDLSAFAGVLKGVIEGKTPSDEFQSRASTLSDFRDIQNITLPSCITAYMTTLEERKLRRPSRFVQLWPENFPDSSFIGIHHPVLFIGTNDSVSLLRNTCITASDELAELSKQVKLGDITPVLKLYENDIRSPLKSVITGNLLRTLFIQVQKAKVDIDQALFGIDKLLKSQELTFAFVGVAPAFGIVYLLGGYISRVWAGGRGRGRYGGKHKRTGVWFIMRRIERLLTSGPQHATYGQGVSPLTAGLLLVSVAHLRAYGEKYLPSRSRLREGFLEDVEDLSNPELDRHEKRMVVERMWRSWGHTLGWGKLEDNEGLMI
ncbi:NCA2-domain-containing protein [Desarmillaria tabescens]|uniref:NCA2-domain-containing protein n=1 Tax=Armillaria tabescens TaxID=1929756 RepID=A0AA39NF65_ARMTA|nr:NCA2-domain-containing protein [Desarmillaria tabescens]KAK0464521.1 NCA2-domain-containing protein [Desarmillaria tabescens]